MENIYVKTLNKYWGYDSFRPLQEEIIRSVCEGKDTLALMPTGGGKSITFQVPGMVKDGICVVITPLIALMKDQVEALMKKGIPAIAVYTGMTRQEIKNNIEKCIYGDVKFLYISPERLMSRSFKIKLGQMNISLLAVDEAHCISEWGYDFRPSYLRIAEVRELFPDIPVLALTATATPDVVDDIQDKLKFKEKNVLKKSFKRDNLVYAVMYSDAGPTEAAKMLKKVKGCGIVYTRNRKKTKEIATFLNANNIKATYYHAGLGYRDREKRQEAWMKNEYRVMVATNAFGMGIDKPDVRIVIHCDVPDNLEAYFQEAGRAGRDGKKSFAVMICQSNESTKLKKRISDSFPKKKLVKQVYVSLGNYLQLQEGEGKGVSFKFNLSNFSKLFKFNIIQAFNSLKILQRSGYIELTDEVNRPTSLMFIQRRDALYDYGSDDKCEEELTKLILRTYTGLFSGFTYIDEEYLAEKMNISEEQVWEHLKIMSKKKIIRIIPQEKTPYILYNEPRLPESYIKLSTEAYRDRKKRYIERVKAVWKYISTTTKCRSRILLEYFGEQNTQACGTCDVCTEKNRKKLTVYEFMELKGRIVGILEDSSLKIGELYDRLEDNYGRKDMKKAVSVLMEERKIYCDLETLHIKGQTEN